MESSAPITDQLDSAGELTPHSAGPESSPTPLAISREQCPSCSATLATDQRYCVECGQRCGAPRLPFTAANVQREQQMPSTPNSRSRRQFRRSRASVNNTIIAGVGTLLLAMGIGVLIGRSGTNSSAKLASPAVQVVTVPGAGAAPAPSTESQTSTSTAPSTKSSGAPSGATAKKSAGAASKKATAAPVKSVKVGTPGKGPGYQKGHFTGNFFGE
jgi:hypothetical protein